MLNRRYLVALVVIILIGAALRFYQLDQTPPGMTHDEAAVGFFIRQVSEQTGFVIEAPYGYANEPFTKYSASPWFWVFGATDWTIRAHQAFWGLVAIAAIYVWVSLAFDPRAGLAAAALQAVAYWPLASSRMALNHNPTAALVTGAAIFLWLALQLHHPKDSPPKARPHWQTTLLWLGFALCLAFSIFSYEAGRSTAAVFPLFLGFLFITRARPIKPLIGFGLAGLLAAVIASVHLLNPLAWGRTTTLSVPLTEARNGNFGPLLANVSEGLNTLFIQGDPFVVYNLPGRPNLDIILGTLLVGAVVWAGFQWRQPRAMFILLWLFFGLLPTLVIGAFTSVLHSTAALTLIMALPAIGTWLIIQRLPHSRQTLAWALLATYIAFTGVWSARDYFVVWAQSPEMRAAYFANFGAVTRWLDNEAPSGAVALSSLFPDYPHDPLTYEFRVQRTDLAVRWFDARSAVVFPNTQTSSLVLPVNAQAHPLLAAALPLNQTTRIAADDPIDPWFDTLTEWQPAVSLASLLNDPSTQSIENGIFGGAAQLIAVQTHQTADGLAVVSIWQVLDPAALGPRAVTEYAARANIFVHLLDENGEIVAQRDELGAPAAFWQTGDHFAQVHTLSAPPGSYPLRIGLYTFPLIPDQSTNLRTPDGQEFVLLPPVTVN